MYNSQQVADVIRTQTTLKKVGIKQMLKDIGLGVNTLSHLDNGSMPKADNLAKIADYLGCSVDYLLGRTDKPEGIETAPAPTGDSLSDEMLTRFNSLDFADKAQVISLIAELSKKKT